MPAFQIPPNARRWLLGLWALSGLATLTLELVWMRQMALHAGNTVTASTLVTAVFFACAAMGNLLGVEERLRGGYMAENRRGGFGFQALPTLSIGAVKLVHGDCESHREVAAAASAAKKQAKKRARNAANEPLGGSLFVERRRVGSFDTPQPSGRTLN